MITPEQVDNVALAVKERRELDAAEKAELDQAMDRAWANLPYHYQWAEGLGIRLRVGFERSLPPLLSLRERAAVNA